MVSVVFLFGGISLIANPIPSGSAISIVAAPVTIADPGSYRLANDVSGDITIDANNVELDLDNRRITAGTDGVSVSSHADIVIKNGIIEGGTNGILVSSCTNVKILDIDFIDNATGINILTVTCVQVDNCTFRGFSSEALCIDNTNNGKFSNCAMKFNDNSSRVVSAADSFNLLFERIGMNNNSKVGAFDVLCCDRLRNCVFKKCSASNNDASFLLQVFFFNSCENCIIEDCQANENSSSNGESVAFSNSNSNNLKFINCTANTN